MGARRASALGLGGLDSHASVVQSERFKFAEVTATTGSPTTGTYTDADGTWRYYKWTGAGSVTLTAGLVDVLVVGGGGGGVAATWNGMGGSVVTGLQYFAAGTHTVTIGSGGPGASGAVASGGGSSAIGSVKTAKSNMGNQDQWGAFGTYYPGPTSSITGSSVEYARGSAPTPRANFGDGGSESGNTSGSAGTVIIRVRA